MNEDLHVQLIASFEGFAKTRPGNPNLAHPYRDPDGVWTIGYGSTKGVTAQSPPVTRAQALARLKREVEESYGAAVDALRLPLNRNQRSALISLAYNCGTGVVAPTTTIGKRLRARDWQGAADAMLMWVKAGGRTLPGLVRRRQAERALFLTPVVGKAKQPKPKARKPASKVPKLGVDYLSRLHNHRHPDVEQLQKQLRKRGWEIVVDRNFGRRTDKTVRKFQCEHFPAAGRVDGRVGPKTWEAAFTAPVR